VRRTYIYEMKLCSLTGCSISRSQNTKIFATKWYVTLCILDQSIRNWTSKL